MLRRKGLYVIGVPIAYVGLGATLVKGYNSLPVSRQQDIPSWAVGTVRFYEANYRVWRCTKAGAYLLFDYLNTTRKYNKQFPEGADRLTIKSFYHPTYQRGADQVLNTLEDLGGVFIKLGQELSMMKGILPSEYTDTLSALQDKVDKSPPHIPINFGNNLPLKLGAEHFLRGSTRSDQTKLWGRARSLFPRI